MTEQFANNIRTTLNGALDNSTTSVVVTSATGMPASGNFRILVAAEGANTDEIMTVSSRSGTTLTVTRASEATGGVQSASAHASGATVTLVLTVASLLQDIRENAVQFPTIVQTKFAGNAAASITLDSTPTSGNSIILALDGFNTGQATNVSSTNTTWTQVKTFNNAGGQKAAIWIGIAAASAGTVITITHPNSFMSARAIEIAVTLTPTLGANTSAEFLTNATLTGVTPGHLIIASSGTDNTTLSNTISVAGMLVGGVLGGIVGIVVGYALGTRVDAITSINAGALILIEVT